MENNNSVSRSIEKIITGFSKYMSLVIVVIMAITTWEVAARYVFNRPTTWAWIVNRQLFGLFILAAGPFTLVERGHIRIEMLYDRFPRGARTFIRYLSFAALVCFIGALIWQGGIMGLEALDVRERAAGMFRMPLYPLKLLIPVFGVIFIIAGIPALLTKRKRS